MEWSVQRQIARYKEEATKHKMKQNRRGETDISYIQFRFDFDKSPVTTFSCKAANMTNLIDSFEGSIRFIIDCFELDFLFYLSRPFFAIV